MDIHYFLKTVFEECDKKQSHYRNAELVDLKEKHTDVSVVSKRIFINDTKPLIDFIMGIRWDFVKKSNFINVSFMIIEGMDYFSIFGIPFMYKISKNKNGEYLDIRVVSFYKDK